MLEWDKLPPLVYQGQIFAATIKYITPDRRSDIALQLHGANDMKLRYIDPHTTHDDLYFYKKIYFKVTGPNPRLPDISVGDATLQGVPLTFQQLSPPPDYCGVVAKKLRLLEHKEVQFTKQLNLVVMKIEGHMANLEDFHIPYAKKQNFKDINDTFPVMRILYYAFIPADIRKLRISYFDSSTREFKSLFFDIVVHDQTVSTQSNITPNEDKNKFIKIVLLVTLGVLLLVLALWKGSWFAALTGLAMLFFAGYLAIPLAKVCVKPGSRIYILPTKNSTVFAINPTQKIYIKLNETNHYTKIKIDDKKVGWVKDEDLCQN